MDVILYITQHGKKSGPRPGEIGGAGGDKNKDVRISIQQ